MSRSSGGEEEQPNIIFYEVVMTMEKKILFAVFGDWGAVGFLFVRGDFFFLEFLSSSRLFTFIFY